MKNNTLKEGTVILSDFQRSGRGRGKNTWHSEQDLNLTFSILFYPRIKPADFFYLTEFVSLAIRDLLSAYDINATIKWPNDIYVSGRKIAGILIENSITGNAIENTIAGIGINVNEVNFPPDIPNPTSMRIRKDRAFDKREVFDLFLEKLKYRYHQLMSGDPDAMHKQYNECLYKKDVFSEYRISGKEIKACLQEIKPSGELILKYENGTVKSCLFGEVEWIV
jgi:BirA family biotin operon repressor/biotin-[acetyl-CoA-carboxylase] ligase